MALELYVYVVITHGRLPGFEAPLLYWRDFASTRFTPAAQRHGRRALRGIY